MVKMIIAAVAITALAGCNKPGVDPHAPTTGGTDLNIDSGRNGVSRFVDKEHGIVCYVVNREGGISCLYIKEKAR